MTEIWKAIPGYEGLYEVSNTGKLRSLRIMNNTTNKERDIPLLLDGSVNQRGYTRVYLSKDGKPKYFSMHALVLLAFVGPRPSGYHGCHNDGNPRNNNLENLRWDTPASNSADRLKHGTDNRGAKHPLSELTEQHIQDIKAMRSYGVPLHIIARAYDMSFQHISDIASNQRWAHLNYEFPNQSAINKMNKKLKAAEALLRELRHDIVGFKGNGETIPKIDAYFSEQAKGGE